MITPSTALKLLEALRVAERVLQTVDWLPASIAKVRAAWLYRITPAGANALANHRALKELARDQ